MIDTDRLIEQLTRETRPVARHAAALRLGLALVAGLAGTLVVIANLLGFRPDLDVAMAGPMFWMKLAYTGSIALIGIVVLLTLVRPGAGRPRRLWLVAVPVVLLGFVLTHELATMPADHWTALWLGQSWRVCSALIFVFALPIGGVLTAFARSLAPTRLATTGAVIGLAAGAASATLYSLHCPEASASFVLTWYSSGIALTTLAGWLLGPRLLRW